MYLDDPEQQISMTNSRHGYTQTIVQMGHIAVVPTHYTPVVPLVPLESRALQRKSLPVVSIPQQPAADQQQNPQRASRR